MIEGRIQGSVDALSRRGNDIQANEKAPKGKNRSKP